MSFTGKTETFLNTEITNDGFFPPIKLGDLQRVYRVPAEYKQELIEHHTRLAIADCNQVLADRKREWIAQGHADLAAVGAADSGLDFFAVHHYQRAVYCRAMGLMVLAFATLNRREAAENLAKESDDTKQEYFAQSGRALRRLLGVTENVTVALL